MLTGVPFKKKNPIESLRGMPEKGVHFAPSYSTKDHWIQESI